VKQNYFSYKLFDYFGLYGLIITLPSFFSILIKHKAIFIKMFSLFVENLVSNRFKFFKANLS
jgi:hypothetical protein